jgi:hypothetical protein
MAIVSMKRKKRMKAINRDVICKLGTLAHNRPFTKQELVEYTGTRKPNAVINWLKSYGHVRKVRGGYYPTGSGWNMIEKACRVK